MQKSNFKSTSISILFLMIGVLTILSCKKEQPLKDEHFELNVTDSLKPEFAKKIFLFFKNENYDSIAKYIHPTENLRFSQYNFADIKNDNFFSSETFLLLVKNPVPILWGSYDATGDTIFKNWIQYNRKFVFDVDFSKPEKFSINKSFSNGNSIDNLDKVYKNSQFAEAYYSGFDAKYQGLDWRTLKLVFKKHNNKWCLVGVIHNQWTS